MDTIIALITLAGATSWLTTAFVLKSGPWQMLLTFRNFIHRLTHGHSPLTCFTCTSFWVALVLVSVWYGGTDEMRALITLFAVAGLGQALRGMSGEY